MEKTSSHEKKLLAATALLIAAVLCLSATVQNTEKNSRAEGTYGSIENVTVEKREEAEAPAGLVSEYRFTLGEV